MTLTEEKQKITVIAEGMGWTISQEWPNNWINPKGKIVYEGLFQVFNPLKSDNDFWGALDEIFERDQISVSICEQDGPIWFQLYDRKTSKQYDGFGEDRLEAGCDALTKFLKEGK